MTDLDEAVKNVQAALTATGIALREILLQFPVNMIRFTRDLHSPVEVGDDAGTKLCRLCVGAVEWPCRYYTEQDERLRRLADA